MARAEMGRVQEMLQTSKDANELEAKEVVKKKKKHLLIFSSCLLCVWFKNISFAQFFR